MKTFKISISTPAGKTFESNEAVTINANLLEGRIGVYANHAPLLSSLKISDFSIKLEDGTLLRGVIRGGVFNVSANEVTILTTKFKFDNEIVIKDVQDEINNLNYQLNGELLPTEKETLESRMKYNQELIKRIS